MNNKLYFRSILYVTCTIVMAMSSTAETIYPGADESSPSRAQYFSWINNTNEGATEAQTLANFEFFEWMHQEYGMQLDIYAFDAGALDGKRWYGSMDSEKFKAQFPRGFEPLYKRAKALNFRLGIWGGPDGFGTTQADQNKRIRQMVSLCRDFEFELFKFDSVAGQLRDAKQDAFADMMTQCRHYSPDLILLNHRLNLGETGSPHATTFLWEGQETYIDVHLENQAPAPHHRAAALARGLPPGLSRLTEDHGVCLSNSLDYWDDELVLQAFNRNLILAPQIYCNPWLLRDDEYPKLARIFNLARRYKTLLTSGVRLPEERYGLSAMSRGDSSTRLITLRNLSWKPKTITLVVDEELGLLESNKLWEVRRYHPGERILGKVRYGQSLEVVVEPFRAALIRVTSNLDWGIESNTYEVIKEVQGEPIEILKVENSDMDIRQVTHRKIARLQAVAIPDNAERLYEATVYSTDNNALEVRALNRSGPTKVPTVRKARDAFFNQEAFINRGLWDKNLFDNDLDTHFYKMQRWNYNWNRDPDSHINGGAFRLDFGRVERIDRLVLISRDDAAIQPLKQGEGIIGEVSSDMKTWVEVRFLAGRTMRIEMPVQNFPVRYFRLSEAPNLLSEVKAYQGNIELSRDTWRASNLFGHFREMQFVLAWQHTFRLDKISDNAYLTVPIEGKFGNESVYASLEVEGQPVGAADRAPAYPANTWELQVKPVTGNYTYYIPLDKTWAGKSMTVTVLGTQQAAKAEPEVWLSNRPIWPESTPLKLPARE